MKAPRFWYQSHNPLGHMLAPLGIFYRVGHMVRTLLAKSYKAKVPVICIGNIVVGGSGKTPTALAVAELLTKAGHTPGFVTRGYGGHHTGVTRVDPSRHTIYDVGDEALLLTRGAPTWVGRDRVAAIQAAEQHVSHIICDDGMQNPTFYADKYLLVIDGGAGLGNEYFLPAGPLRESLEHALPRVATVIMIGEDRHHLSARMNRPLLRATLEPDTSTEIKRDVAYVAFAGIGRPEKFYDTCRALGLQLAATHDFPDHHVFTLRDLDMLQASAIRYSAQLITTEKDFVRLPTDFQTRVTVLPIKLTCNEGELRSALGLV